MPSAPATGPATGPGQNGDDSAAHGGAASTQDNRPVDRLSSLSGVSSWVGYYLDGASHGSKDEDRTAPADSNDNAGVREIQGQDGDAALTTEASGPNSHLDGLRGPVPIIIFSLLALGGVATVIGRSAKSLAKYSDDSGAED